MGWFVIIFLIVLGVLALMLEVLVLPGGIVGIIGALFVIAGVVLSYVHFGLWAGNITLLITAVFIIGTVILFLRSKTWKKMALTTEIDSKVNVLPSELKVGMEGVTISRLAPEGLFGDQEESVLKLSFIDQNQGCHISN